MHLETETELHIIRQCKTGKLKYQEKLYRHFYGYAMSIGLRYAHDQEEALEIVNDSFLKVFHKIAQHDEQRSFKAWLRKIIINTAIDYHRKHAKYHQQLDIAQAEQESDSVSIIDKMSAEEILALIQELPQTLRLVFNLYEIEGYAHREIATLLKIPENSSRTYLTRAKRQLRVLVEQYFSKDYERAV